MVRRGGIYRHVWLIKTSLLSVNLWGVYAKPVRQEDGTWQVQTQTEVRNDTLTPHRITLIGEITDESGAVVATARTSGTVAEKEIKTLCFTHGNLTPALWSPDSPTQYVMRVRVLCGKREEDVYEVKFGFRTVEADAQKGLFINGKHYKIKGLCGHADFGLTGKAVPDNIHRYKVALMKQMGANGYRTSHYPQASELMDALDENGFLVMDETRWFESTEEGKAQLEMLMKRDRNRPSVIFWSIGNEEPYHTTEAGRKIAQSLIAFAKKLDDTRIITTAVLHSPEQATVCDELEVVGVNYNWDVYEAIHEKYPQKAVLSSENCATGTTRGHYLPDLPERSYITAYDHDSSQLFRSREYTWKFISERDWMLGGYQWIAFEHRGEAIWPRLCSQSGAVDLFMQKKDAFYQNRSHWTDEPMVHLLPHWNFKGLEGHLIKVFAYTNVPQVELFLNGKSLGMQTVERVGHGEWLVPYEEGELEAVAYQNGEIVARDKRVTASAPTQLRLTLETPGLCANGADIAVISCYAVDEKGNEVPDAQCEVTFSTNGLGRIYSTGSDISDHSTLFSPTRKMRAGRIGVAVKVGEQAGELAVYAAAAGMGTAILKVDLK